MVTISPAAMVMSGKPDPSAFVDVRSIGGLSPETNATLSQQICRELQQGLGVPPERVYLNFTDVQAIDWGWNGETFG
jgi:phenylpyruvate tautomerase PptA (4-oxalocrotonate tautomerase family)